MTNDHGSRADNDAAEAKAMPNVDTTNHPEDQPDNGSTVTIGGAMPAGPEMGHWNTAMARPDATKPETMPNTASKALPGERNHADREAV